ncbi:MAG: hypothetical protein EXR63_00920 [Dehalococcoidia bacterium]|nr:hypothetical protein [Dehalococcoidia bacterium]
MIAEPAREASAGEPVGSFTVEATTWVSKLVGGDDWGTVDLREPLVAGDTVRSGLRRVSERYPPLRDTLWTSDTHELSEHLHVMVNARALGVERTLDSPLHADDVITLLGQFAGG